MASIDIHIKRAYEKPSREDGFRVLVDRLWPRGVKKTDLKVRQWLKDLAPSTELRKWFNHDPARWDEFRKRYTLELRSPAARQAAAALITAAKSSSGITLVYGAKDTEHNEAVVLQKMLQRLATKKP